MKPTGSGAHYIDGFRKVGANLDSEKKGRCVNFSSWSTPTHLYRFVSAGSGGRRSRR